MRQIAVQKSCMLISIFTVLLYLFTSCSSEENTRTNISDGNTNTLTPLLYDICTDWNETPNGISSSMSKYLLKKADKDIMIYVNRSNGQHVSFKFINEHLSASAVIFPIADDEKIDVSMISNYKYIGDVEGGCVSINKSDNVLATVWQPFVDEKAFAAISFTPITSSEHDGNETYCVSTNDNVVVLPTRAEVEGVVEGVDGACEVGFIYGLKAELPSDEVKTVNGVATRGNFKLTLAGLLDDEDYYYRAYAVIDEVRYYGEVKKFHTEPLTYIMDGVEYKMIKVEGGPLGDFSIMQTELHPGALLTIGDMQMTSCLKDLDRKDNKITKYEFSRYLAELKNKTGLYWRLPTSKERKYAYQGGDKSKGYKYSGSDDVDEVAWYSLNSGSCSHIAATKKSNELGLFDMSGNFAELTNDLQIDNIKKHQYNSINISSIMGDVFGGDWESPADKCTKDSWIPSPANGTGENFNVFDCTCITVRLIYDRCAKDVK